METEEKFNEIYQKIVNQNANNMEIARKEAKSERKNNHIILAGILIINIVIYNLINRFSEILSAFLFCFLLFVSLVAYLLIKHRGGNSKISKYNTNFKTKIVEPIIKSFDEKLEFTPQSRCILYFFWRSRF